MLLRFGVENFLSIKEYQEVNLVATRITDDVADLIQKKGLDSPTLPAIALYGANASGKSNVLAALDFIIKGIRHSFTHAKSKKDTPSNVFQLDKEYNEKPSRFDIDFLIDRVRYHYGFVIKGKLFNEEWLYSYPTGKRRVLFHRQAEETPVFYFGKHLKGKNKTIVELTKANSLFLSTAAEANHTQLGLIYDYFTDMYEDKIELENSEGALNEFLAIEEVKRFFIRFLKFADTGITDITVEEVELNIPEEIQSSAAQLEDALGKYSTSSTEEMFPKKADVIKFGHKAKSDEIVYFGTTMESKGTLVLLEILGPVFGALALGKILYIDEIDSSLHPLLTTRIIQLFNNKNTNLHGAQLLFTTHDTNLLTSKALRRDQIWFTEKAKDGATYVYPLSNIRTRKNDNFEKGYLEGRFGAIPFLGQISEVLSDDEEL